MAFGIEVKWLSEMSKDNKCQNLLERVWDEMTLGIVRSVFLKGERWSRGIRTGNWAVQKDGIVLKEERCAWVFPVRWYADFQEGGRLKAVGFINKRSLETFKEQFYRIIFCKPSVEQSITQWFIVSPRIWFDGLKQSLFPTSCFHCKIWCLSRCFIQRKNNLQLFLFSQISIQTIKIANSEA